ncbi:hypothetical protein GCM10007919_51440 [Rhizobium indigoferae]|nr:hypothetical protein GCM10007919_51440 [Rhizobium indigoferae]
MPTFENPRMVKGSDRLVSANSGITGATPPMSKIASGRKLKIPHRTITCGSTPNTVKGAAYA